MFDSLKSIVGGLNIFDLRAPAQFRFYSIHGFAIYLLSYALVVIYDTLFTDKCINAVASGWQDIAKQCGLSAGAIVFPFFYMLGAYVVISLFKRTDWSADAVFNNLSLLIVIEALVTGLVYQFGLVRAVQGCPLCYFIALGVLAVAALGAISVLAERHARPPQWTLAMGLRASPGIVRLTAIYVVLSMLFFIVPYAVKFGLTP